ncbi:helix-turn-helix domain-containing protein [Grimontia hollisae]|uniref:DNA-binding protein n=1 Tax=Grimontia hollisae TaxID=673 RepID=A0A377HLZ2_GRIHO|nr:helix-turn-helix domain-containing protein [Grimontia hollisae]MDF2183499.1 helix-turn-helix domain-containing protein [Grimontia hollisae]STO56722.1 Uncharacterised protein [Grimontia hollisae]STQ74574.1 Uncharacterised protein [Grimontia hollisae]
MLSFSVAIPAPYMTSEEYARFTGMTHRTVKDWITQGKIITAPKVKKGETPMVNVIAMTEKASREANQILGHAA